MIEPKLEDTQCGFRPGRSTTDQILTLQQIFEESWKYDEEVHACLLKLEKAYDRVLREKLWGAPHEYGIDSRPVARI